MDRLRKLGFSLKDVTREYAWHFEQQAPEMSLKFPAYKVLTHLERREGISQIRLAEIISIKPMAMVRILERMEARCNAVMVPENRGQPKLV